MKNWTNEEIEKAKTLLIDGFRYEEIGIRLNRTERSIKSKLEKLGFKFYQFNPTREKRKCIKCSNEFEVLKTDYKKFCGSSCSASYNNLTSKRKYEKYIKCKNCNKDFENNARGNRQYCNNTCKSEFDKNEKFNLIKNGKNDLSSKWYKKYLIEYYGERCMECDWCERSKYSKNIPIELEHIDGNSENNDLKNLKLLCPNCHSLTPTYKALNKGNGRHKRMRRYKEGKSY